MAKMKVLTEEINTLQLDNQDYISLTDIAKAKESETRAADVIKNWLRNRSTLEFIGTWEHLYNPNLKWSNSTTLKCHLVYILLC